MIADLETIRFEKIGDVLRVVIDRPDSELNAIDARLHDDLCSTVRMLKDLDDVRAVVLTGHGRAFSAGGDFGWFPALEEPRAREHLRRKGKQLIWDLLDVEVPIVAAINGPAMGLGATLALLCDVIFISEEATIGDPHVRVGIVAGDGGTAIWPLAVGPALAKRYLLTGDSIGAEEAYRLGLVTHVVPSGALEAEALAFARRLAQWGATGDPLHQARRQHVDQDGTGICVRRRHRLRSPHHA